MALQQIPNPFGLDWRTWADTVVGFNPSLRPNVDPDEPWMIFADRLSLYEPATPRPISFRNWQDWACALKQAYPN